MEVVGESVLSAALQVLFGKWVFPEVLNFARQEGIIAELENWKEKLMMINEVLDEAEEKQTSKPSVKNWLDNLRDLAYDMEDVLDEFATELLRRKLMSEGADQVATTSKVRSLIPTCFTGFNPVDEVKFNIEMGTKIKEITRRLGDSSTRKAELGFDMVPGVETDGVSGVRDHIIKLKHYFNKANEMKVELSEKFLKWLILESLPASFDAVKLTYNALKEEWTLEVTNSL
ncbi:hypothetical protein VitviT2T_010395 [Vitis vinifera]|uniref:Disease resistance N-terminal domain-containing protein n=1 Tax=Vitis vinifera TaxID=29760 RepID=A0ABY9CAY5_VITVI|nr:hypothetical protein VitviT2T_010395 [Vitis vinifera]